MTAAQSRARARASHGRRVEGRRLLGVRGLGDDQAADLWDEAAGVLRDDIRTSCAMLSAHSIAAQIGYTGGPTRNDTRARRIADAFMNAPPFRPAPAGGSTGATNPLRRRRPTRPAGRRRRPRPARASTCRSTPRSPRRCREHGSSGTRSACPRRPRRRSSSASRRPPRACSSSIRTCGSTRSTGTWSCTCGRRSRPTTRRSGCRSSAASCTRWCTGATQGARPLGRSPT